MREWLPWIDATRGPADSRRFLEISYTGFLRGAGFSFGIRFHGALVGVIGFHGFDRPNRVTSLGYWQAKDVCGQGIMRRSVAACIEYAVEKQGMHRICIRCARGNERSRRIVHALGFHFEGVQREAEWLYDHFVDLEMYSLLSSEWQGTSALGF